MNLNTAVARSMARSWIRLTSYLKSKIDGRTLRKIHGLKFHGDPSFEIPPNAIVLVAYSNGEAGEISDFLGYHRELGIGHSILIFDEERISEASEFLDESSITVVSINSREQSVINCLKTYLLRTHADNRWILNCEINEYLVFPKMEIRSLSELLAFMDDANRRSVFTPIIEVYSEKPHGPGESLNHLFDPSRSLMFDASGYYSSYGSDSEFEIKGGPSLRISHAGNHTDAPLMNRTGLFKQRPGTRLASHKKGVLKPDVLNHVHHWKYPCPTGALLRPYPAKELSAKRAAEIWDVLVGPVSRPYKGTTSLIESRLMESGIWE